MDKEMVSVIMPSYNSAKKIRESIDSILRQTHSNLELLITDDRSDDEETISILKEYAAKDSRIKVFVLPQNNGAGVARNNSITHATGRYIAFCDSDDMWLPEKLEKQLAFMKETDCCLSYGPYLTCNYDGEITGKVKAPEKLTLAGEKHDNKIGCLTAMYDTTKYGKFYMPKIRKRQDWALFLTILKRCGTAYSVGEPLAIYRNTPNSISKNKLEMMKYNARVYQEVFGYGVLHSYAYLLFVFLPCYFTKKIMNFVG